jgi:hypothetical protein
MFIHLAVCLTTGPKPLPNRAVHIVRSKASSFRCEYPLLSLRSSSSFLRLIPHFPVISIPPFWMVYDTLNKDILECRNSSVIRVTWLSVGWPRNCLSSTDIDKKFFCSCRFDICSGSLTYLCRFHKYQSWLNECTNGRMCTSGTFTELRITFYPVPESQISHNHRANHMAES